MPSALPVKCKVIRGWSFFEASYSSIEAQQISRQAKQSFQTVTGPFFFYDLFFVLGISSAMPVSTVNVLLVYSRPSTEVRS